MRRHCGGAIAVIAMCVLGSAASGASAATATFSGSCSFDALQVRLNQGFAAFGDGPLQGVLAGPGFCTGAIDGRSIDQRVSTLVAPIAGHGSCALTAELAGSGTFNVDGVEFPVNITLTKPSAAPVVDIDLQGTSSGSAIGSGPGDVAGDLDPGHPTTGAVGCLDGNARTTAIDESFATQTPLVSTLPNAPSSTPARRGSSHRSKARHGAAHQTKKKRM